MAEFYHFAQPNVAAATPILNPVESQIKGFQAIAWRTPLSGIKGSSNYAEATIYSFSTDYVPNASGMCAVQVQNNWGGLDRTKGINAWDSTKYGSNQDKVKLSFGGMISLPFSTAPYLTDSSTGYKYPANYADFYLRGIDLKIGKSYWLQFFFYDNRGMPGNHFLPDVFTGEDTFVGTIKTGASQYLSLLPSSNSYTQQPFTDSRFIGASVSRKQFSNLMTGMRGLSNKQYSLNPDDHRIFAYGCTPELGRADTGACMKLTMYNLFLRTEY